MKLMILDGNSIINRAFYGIRLLSTKDGLYTNAVYGFLTILNKLMEEESPDALCVAFDLEGPTFRHEEFDGYKAQRKGMPEELAVQLPVLKQVLTAMNIPIYQLKGYEADDLIGTVGRVCTQMDWDCVVVTGDRDSLQLVCDRVVVRLVSTRNGQTTTVRFDTAKFIEEYGFEPEKLVDLKGLMGDSSDNIPGVAGIGEKTAKDLIGRFGSIKAIYADLDRLDIKEAVRKKLEAGRDYAELSYRLATIDRYAPIDFSPEEALCRDPEQGALYDLLVRLEFTKLIEKYQLRDQGALAAITEETVRIVTGAMLERLEADLLSEEMVAIAFPPSIDAVAAAYTKQIYVVCRRDFDDGRFGEFLALLFSKRVQKCAHDVKSAMTALLEQNLPTDGFVFDTSLAAYIINPSENGYGLEKTALGYLGQELPGRKLYTDPDAFSPLLSDEGAVSALSRHAGVIFRLAQVLKEKISELSMDRLYYDVELPLCKVLSSMEHEGFLIDREHLEGFSVMLTEKLEESQNRIYDLAGGGFNINSPKQLGEVLFDKLELPAVKKTKTGYSTNIDVLEKLRGKHPIIEEIMNYRQYAKLKSTYADGLLKVIGGDGRIHTSFNMTATATGRLSSTEPNLQNIPVRQDMGSEIRKMFVARPGWVLVDADYSQIELRVLAHISDDPVMKRAFADNEDIHTVTASQVFGVLPEEVTALMRRHAKAVNFGIVYGISDFSLAEDIGVARSEAKAYIDSYLEKYSGVRFYMENVVKDARETGYVQTLMGRRRYLPELHSSNFNIRSGSERIALNTPIQGTAADIIKLAMIHIYDRLEKEKMAAKLILQVHDELMVEAPEAEAEKVMKILTEEMEEITDYLGLSVSLVAEAKCGKTWYDAK